MASTRRLTAILAADVAGYSRLMGADEEGTHERLKAHLGQLVDPKIREHRGHIVKNTGDGMLAEFPSVVDAVRCAAEVQRGMIDREPEATDEQQIRFRVGIRLWIAPRNPLDVVVRIARIVKISTNSASGFRQRSQSPANANSDRSGHTFPKSRASPMFAPISTGVADVGSRV